MSLLVPTKLEHYRHRAQVPSFDPRHADFWSSNPGDNFGAFHQVPGPCGEKLNILASDGLPLREDGWEHVSVSLARSGKARVPNWEEMCFVKNLFWQEEDCVVQFHPPKSEHVSNYRVLHMWRCLGQEFPRPPGWMVGIKALGELK
jgi:hypothetical protein